MWFTLYMQTAVKFVRSLKTPPLKKQTNKYSLDSAPFIKSGLISLESPLPRPRARRRSSPRTRRSSRPLVKNEEGAVGGWQSSKPRWRSSPNFHKSAHGEKSARRPRKSTGFLSEKPPVAGGRRAESVTPRRRAVLFRGGQPPHGSLHVYPRFVQSASRAVGALVGHTPSSAALGRRTRPPCTRSPPADQRSRRRGGAAARPRLAWPPASTAPKASAAAWWWYSEPELRGARVGFSWPKGAHPSPPQNAVRRSRRRPRCCVSVSDQISDLRSCAAQANPSSPPSAIRTARRSRPRAPPSYPELPRRAPTAIC
ncbi:hypothetical protein Zmor_012788 [Zophobas morio]|uniref:Uncharacterized protein n=1 Tax=Zophobas morio TaxID=2755281 RepID=A0AA38MEJ5_9CUCU|nr:hypothetical protein Zmor_012788 [Zophobas morio]